MRGLFQYVMLLKRTQACTSSWNSAALDGESFPWHALQEFRSSSRSMKRFSKTARCTICVKAQIRTVGRGPCAPYPNAVYNNPTPILQKATSSFLLLVVMASTLRSSDSLHLVASLLLVTKKLLCISWK